MGQGMVHTHLLEPPTASAPVSILASLAKCDRPAELQGSNSAA